MLILCDLNPVQRIKRPYLTWAFAGAAVLLTLALWFDAVPWQWLVWQPHRGWFPGLLLASLAHADPWHLVGNLLPILAFGDNVEDALGHARFLLLILAAALGGALAQYLASPDMELFLGASAVTSAVMGGYLLLHPKARVVVAFNVLIGLPMAFPAGLIVGTFLLANVIGAVTAPSSAIAWWAHLAGFLAGVLLTWLLRDPSVPILQPPQSAEAILAGTGAVQRRAFVLLDWLGSYKIRSGRGGERPAIEELARRRFFHRFILFVVLTLLGELVLG